MTNLAEEVSKYIDPKKRARPLEFEFAAESYGCDSSISELTVPHVIIYIPKGFIRKYNLATIGKNLEALPNANKFWEFLNPHLVGRGLVAQDEFDIERPVDEIVKELLEWPHGASFESCSNTREGVLLNVKADYDPYWEDSEEA